MREWDNFVRARLRGNHLERHQEIIVELADHLEDAERDGNQDVQVFDWARFSEEIRRAEEENMATRLRVLWIPGLMTSILSVLLLRLVQYAGFRPFVAQVSGQSVALFYAQWLVLLPLVGASGAFACNRAGGGRWVRLLTAAFSSAALLVLFTLLWLGTVVVALFQGDTLPHLRMLCTGFGIVVGAWVLLPGAALALGVLPFLRSQKTAEPEEPHLAHA